MTFLRSVSSRGLSVRTFMPSATVVVHEAGKPRRPSISTRHRRHEPKAFSVSVAQSLGIWLPTEEAARMSDVPSGTVTATPSISSVISLSAGLGGVPASTWSIECMSYPSANRLHEVLWKVLQGAPDRERRHAAEPAQGAVYH